MTAADVKLIPAVDGVYAGIPDEAYHADRASLSSSGARSLLSPSCPAIFHHEQQQPPKPKKQYDFGHAAHKYVLGEGSEIAVLDPAVHGLNKDGTRSKAPTHTAMWQQAVDEARQRGQVPMSVDEDTKARAMAAKVREHPLAAALLADGTPELSGYWHDPETGVRLRFRPDWLPNPGRGRLVVVDYKTSTSASPAHFAKAAAEYGYHQQVPWYLDGLAAAEISDDAAFVFIVQSKDAPYLVSVMELDPQAVDLGRRRNRRAIDLYARCVANDHWPDYGQGIHPVSLPNYAVYSQEGDLDQ
ncbi:PD-(D/E)XK nuclease-like domain-containing protein [Mycobacteroides abscessus]|uniref:PD-(D/E)XK nuclease-like domain-containing protein n=1 Tax=Mycobacteroides abscessus TaxID=36809 RepID=UPI00092A2B7D|nr:PD-(D/E)XK nuclease-like domain-containing protein [Mycobacteroides abscessus]SHZ23499.1 gp60 protein [Mycobacteroides abscessus subsp. abscessus]SHZ91065.1 gp60 protein [Mycobacteroides abscessus subsp. abscessus]SHZ91641.1 gp60 protein [Mycobacteroides abscessus subsp. abscessus]SIA62792.1 gp60 protein [Mycobacteroides abscessus subsp. abscessus]SIC37304.1 recE [Mycobacteroides abscessus subsp. abscessus]